MDCTFRISSVTGINLLIPGFDHWGGPDGFDKYLTFNGTLTGSRVTVSGRLNFIWRTNHAGEAFDSVGATIQINIGGKGARGDYGPTDHTLNWSEPFSVSLDVPTGAAIGRFDGFGINEYVNLGNVRALAIECSLIDSALPISTPRSSSSTEIEVDHIVVSSPYDYVNTGDDPFTVTAIVFGAGDSQVPDGTSVTFSLKDKEGGTLGGAGIRPQTAETVNSEVSATFTPPRSSYWSDTLHSDYAGVNTITIVASAGGKQGGYEITIEGPADTGHDYISPPWDSTTPPTTPAPFKLCIIATATYGSTLAPEVVFMRSVRDDLIGSSPTGRVLVDGWNAFYYSWSTPVAQSIAGSNGLKAAFKVVLAPLLGSMYIVAGTYHAWAWINPDLAAVIAFTTAAVLSICIYIALPLLATRYAVKSVKNSRKKLASAK